MTNERKFYRVVFQVEVLIDDEDIFDDVQNWNLESINYEITDGSCSGNFGIIQSQEVSGPEMVKLLQDQGSDPEFFSLDEDGNNIDN